MKKRMAGMLLCFAMVCSVTAGCGQTGAKKEAAGNSAAGQEQTKEQSADGSTVGKKINLLGMERICLYGRFRLCM